MKFFKNLFIKILQAGDGGNGLAEKAEQFTKTGGPIGIVTFIIGTLTNWYWENQGFTLLVLIFVGINSLLGGWMHWKHLEDFDWEKLLLKTSTMILVIGLTYFVLESIISIAGRGMIVNGFRSSLQIATLLYPGMKIIKSTFIISEGEHPPKWIMAKLYNFNKNGDLRQFLESRPPEDDNMNLPDH